jgi:hypothetical protein
VKLNWVMDLAVYETVYETVDLAMRGAVQKHAYWHMCLVVSQTGPWALPQPVRNAPRHPALVDFLASVDQGAP